MSRNGPLLRTDLTPELLMAFADGTLSDDLMEQIAAFVDEDPDLQQEVADYFSSADVLKGAFDEVLDAPVPDQLTQMVLSGTSHPTAQSDEAIVSLSAEREKRRPGGWTPGWAQGIAACALVAIGGVIGLNIQPSTDTQDPHALVYAGVLSQDSPLRTALSNTRSGEIVAVADGSVKPLQTFITGEGTVCREYEAKRAQDGVTGIACWSEDTWRVETLVANAQAVNDTGSSLMPASGFDTAALEAALEDMGALPGLDADAEQCLIANAWNSGPCQ